MKEMNLNALIEYCASKPEARMEFPFGAIPICFKYHGRLFAEIYPNEADFKITVRCDPDVGTFLREEYPGTVVPGYHVPLRQRRFKNTILLDGQIEDTEIFRMIDHSYSTID
jgi:predicted DNA-binding protein (MmcQ/YjbR family)